MPATPIRKRTISFLKHATWVALLSVVVAPALLARPGTVKTTDGRAIEGDVTEHADGVTVSNRGIDTVVPRAQVATIEYGGNVEAQFKARIEALDDKDVVGRLAIAREAFDARKYLVARDAVDSALLIDPNNRDAVDFGQTIRSQMRLEAASRGAQAAPGKPTGPTSPTTAVPSPIERKFLTPEDVNDIRQRELTSGDAAIRMRFDNDVRRRFALADNRDYTGFLALSPFEQANAIFVNGDPKLRKDVKVLTDPTSLREYRQVVQPVVLRNCATSGCHGGEAGGSFLLYSSADSEETTYTNFYILQQYTKAAPNRTPATGLFGGTGGQMRMIDRAQPQNSLIIQYALPVDTAEYDHPQVPGWRPGFTGLNDRNLARVTEWIGKTLSPLEPTYNISYVPPSGKAASTTQPATRP